MPGFKQVFRSAVTESHATDVEGVGNIRIENDGKVYRYVKNADTVNGLGANMAACHNVTGSLTLTQNVLLPTTATLMMMAGIVSSTTLTISTGATPYGWIQIAGPCLAIMPVGTLTAGNTFLPTNAAGYLTSDTAAGTAPKYPRGAILITDNTATTGNNTTVSTVMLKNLFN